jgi:hypothetical protein
VVPGARAMDEFAGSWAKVSVALHTNARALMMDLDNWARRAGFMGGTLWAGITGN